MSPGDPAPRKGGRPREIEGGARKVSLALSRGLLERVQRFADSRKLSSLSKAIRALLDTELRRRGF